MNLFIASKVIKFATQKLGPIISDSTQIGENTIKETYQKLPASIRSVVNEDQYVKFILENSNKIREILAK